MNIDCPQCGYRLGNLTTADNKTIPNQFASELIPTVKEWGLTVAGERLGATEAFENFCTWSGGDPSMRSFGMALKMAGGEQRRSQGKRYWLIPTN